VGRHLRGSSKPRWHIDYLRRIAFPIALWLAPDTHLECAWAQHLLAQPGLSVIVPRFGASDCNCTTHLVHASKIDLHSLNLPGRPQLIPC
jgi:Uri superfamily endonuclease